MMIKVVLQEDYLLHMDFAVVSCNMERLIQSVRRELLKKAAMNYPKGVEDIE